MRRAVLLLAFLLLFAAPAVAIVGGHEPTRSYPAMAALQQDGDFVCGANLVRPRWVLTAAHCALDEAGDPLDPSRLSFVLGRTRLSSDDGEEIAAARVIVHERYGDPAEASNDVAVVMLERDAVGTPIRIVPPSEQALWAPGATATAIGWGGTFYPGIGGVNTTDDLMEIQVPMVADGDCDASYSIGLTGDFEASTMVCAGETGGGRDTCSGDSGGPLMVPDATGAMVLAGVISWGFGCGYPTQYGVYARVGGQELYDWIAAKVGPVATATPTATPTPGPTATPAPASLQIVGIRRKGRRLRVRLSATGELRSLRAQALRRGLVIAQAVRPVLSGTTTIKLRLPKRTSGRLRVKIRARGADGAVVRASRSV